MRIFPLFYTEWAFWHIERKYRQPVVVYFHPWEIDPEQPRLPEKLRSRLRHYTNLRKMVDRLRALLERHSFCPFRDLLEMKETPGREPAKAQVG